MVEEELFGVMARHGNAEEANPARLIQYSTSDIIIPHVSTHPMFILLTLVSTQVHGFFSEPNLCPSGEDSVRPID